MNRDQPRDERPRCTDGRRVAAAPASTLHDNDSMWSRVAVLGVWALVALSAAYWALQLFTTPLPAPAQTALAVPGTAIRGDLTRLLGPDPEVLLDEAPSSDEPEPVNDGRFELLGVVSPRSGGAAQAGVALIAVDGQSPRAFRVGASVDGQVVLQTVAHNRVTLGPRDGAATVALELPRPAPAATGTLPQAVPGAGRPAALPVARSFGGPGPTAVPTPRFVSAPPPAAPQPYAPSQVMAQPTYPHQQEVMVQDGEVQEPDPGDPNPLR